MARENPSVEILLVEDSPTQAMQLQRLLERHGYAIRTASTATEALEALKQRLPALVLSDVVMPEMNGYELCRRIKTDSRFKAVPVVLLTVLSDPQDIIAGLQCGADNFIVKPWEESSLLARITHILANRDLRRAGSAQFSIEVMFHGQSHAIKSDRLQMLDLLLASYELAMERSVELKRAKEDAEQANRAKTELLARVAHEMRTPLNAILGFGQLLQLEELGRENDESVRHILEGGDHLLRLTQEMTDLSKIEAGDFSLDCEPIPWEEVVQKCLHRVQPLADKRHLHVRWDRHERNDPYVLANQERLSEILWNLFSNAVKYNREGGAITISDERRENGRLRINVADTGAGIARQSLPLLFIPFERLGAEKRGIEGAGLGLALAKRLAQVMGGTMGVESEEGGGSNFWLELQTQRQLGLDPAPVEAAHR